MNYVSTDTVISTNKLASLRQKFSLLFSGLADSSFTFQRTTASRFKGMFSKKKIGTFLFLTIIAVSLFTALRLVLNRGNIQSSQVLPMSTDVQSVPVEREFSLQVYDKDKKLSDQIRYVITNAQLTKQIIIKGQKATAVKGRIFLILNLKLVNEFNNSLFLNTRNYVRVQPFGAQDKLAPEIHNDTVEVQPLSTKLTRIGLPVNEENKEFTVFVGEIDGQKEEINIKF